jgi:hypothetical protein
LDTARSHLGCLVLASVAYVMASQGSTGANCDEAMRTSLMRRREVVLTRPTEHQPKGASEVTIVGACSLPTRQKNDNQNSHDNRDYCDQEIVVSLHMDIGGAAGRLKTRIDVVIGFDRSIQLMDHLRGLGHIAATIAISRLSLLFTDRQSDFFFDYFILQLGNLARG